MKFLHKLQGKMVRSYLIFQDLRRHDYILVVKYAVVSPLTDMYDVLLVMMFLFPKIRANIRIFNIIISEQIPHGTYKCSYTVYGSIILIAQPFHYFI